MDLLVLDCKPTGYIKGDESGDIELDLRDGLKSVDQELDLGDEGPGLDCGELGL